MNQAEPELFCRYIASMLTKIAYLDDDDELYALLKPTMTMKALFEMTDFDVNTADELKSSIEQLYHEFAFVEIEEAELEVKTLSDFWQVVTLPDFGAEIPSIHPPIPMKYESFTFDSYEDWWHDKAGFAYLSVSHDYEVYGAGAMLDAGDLALADVRGQTGAYCIDHATNEMNDIKLWVPEYAGIHEFVPRKMIPSSMQLFHRFNWLWYLFSDNHEWGLNNDLYEDVDAARIDKLFEREKESLPNDPFLSGYWLLHFAVLDDPRLDDVMTIMAAQENIYSQSCAQAVRQYREYFIAESAANITDAEAGKIFNEQYYSRRQQLAKSFAFVRGE